MVIIDLTQTIYRWNGKYFGFIWQNKLWDKNDNYVGWVDGKEVWSKDGSYLGDLVDDMYVLRPTRIERRSCEPLCEPSEKPEKPNICSNREPREARKDYVDALDDF